MYVCNLLDAAAEVPQIVEISLNADYTMDMEPFFTTMITFFIIVMVFTGQHPGIRRSSTS
jgi:hypothetical protein